MPKPKPLPPSQAEDVTDSGADEPVTEVGSDPEIPSPDAAPPSPDDPAEPVTEPIDEPDLPGHEPDADGMYACPMCQGEGRLLAEPRTDPTAHRCPDCDGHGQVYTGSRVPESAVRPCNRCEAKGFVSAPGTVAGLTLGAELPAVSTSKQFYDPQDPETWTLPTRPGFADVSAA